MTAVLNQLFFDQREKILIKKRIAFSVKKPLLQIRSAPNRSKGWYKVGTLSFQTSLLNNCHESADKWADDVLRRLSSIDLVASDAVYHGQCESNVFTKKYMPTTKGAETDQTPGGRAGNAMK